jgi:hypothetical protein
MAEEFRPAAGEHVMTELRPALQPLGKGLGVFQCDQPVMQRIGLDHDVLLGGRIRRQQQACAQPHQRRCPHCRRRPLRPRLQSSRRRRVANGGTITRAACDPDGHPIGRLIQHQRAVACAFQGGNQGAGNRGAAAQGARRRIVSNQRQDRPQRAAVRQPGQQRNETPQRVAGGP